ncbi:hypothetical protein C1752_00274 [Acaryochloris thomasi RCC1774]|uniref:WYL domain-containing protein n=1 Tax=Acaryochloris thomasi RCC1774 TaxID=1764569 RepID=A0A2W1JPE8_9CYAN|nr:nucleotidyl transferase AbiEii/AbiGii toxin family protein [Acaryochloris thomasi]PZD75116.1 hypothetical protein C1752_00274 [Acaryochloris thomasi RCC1774]
MITETEVKDLAIKQGVTLPRVEKDYVMGWLLWGIYNDPVLSKNLVLKGGNCLRKVYFPDTRFSDDLDFTAFRLDTKQVFHQRLNTICENIHRACGIDFDFDNTLVKTKQTPDKDCTALDGRVYFRGFAGDASVSMRIKFDISQFEKIVLPLQNHSILHNYSDIDACKVLIRTYSLEEVLAEKLRSWIQRTRSRDLFDVVKIVQSEAVPISNINILSAFFQKTIFKDIPLAGQEEMLYGPKFEGIENSWLKTVISPQSSIIAAGNAISLFKDFINALFKPEILEAAGFSQANVSPHNYNVRSGVREAIIEAGKVRKSIRMQYKGRERNIEPYSFRYKITQRGYGAEYFYGFDRTSGATIKSFFLHQIEGVSILPEQYIPRWHVEFKPDK